LFNRRENLYELFADATYNDEPVSRQAHGALTDSSPIEVFSNTLTSFLERGRTSSGLIYFESDRFRCEYDTVPLDSDDSGDEGGVSVWVSRNNPATDAKRSTFVEFFLKEKLYG